MTGFTQDYFIPFLLLLGGSAGQVGVLNAMQNIVASILQLNSADFVDKFGSRKKVMVTFVFCQAVMLLPLFLLAWYAKIQMSVYIVFVTLFVAFGAIATPAWSSIMADLVAHDKRGEYFGWRSKMLGFTLVAANACRGWILSVLKRTNAFYGFAIIFLRGLCFPADLAEILDPDVRTNDHYEKNIFYSASVRCQIPAEQFCQVRSSGLGMNFSVYLAAPFMPVFMLRDLHYSYISIRQ